MEENQHNNVDPNKKCFDPFDPFEGPNPVSGKDVLNDSHQSCDQIMDAFSIMEKRHISDFYLYIKTV